MATGEAVVRWTHALTTPINLYDSIKPMWTQPAFPHAQASSGFIATIVEPVLELWNAHTPSETTDLHELLWPVVQAASTLDPGDTSTAPVTAFIEIVRKARDAVQLLPPTETAEDVVDEMVTTLKLLVLTARLGHTGIMLAVRDHWVPRMQETSKGRTPAPLFFDMLTVQPVDTPGPNTLPFTTVLTSTDPGTATMQEYVSQGATESETETQRRFAGMWMTLWVAKWEKSYRPRLAASHDCTVDDILSPLIGDMVKMRNDYAHHDGIATKALEKCARLQWFVAGQPMQPMQANYEQLFREFDAERGSLVVAPTPIVRDRVQVKGKVSPILRAEYEAMVSELGLRPDEALEEAIGAWIEAGRTSQN
ncbi:hypothetical protein [Williamsia muralis]|nr:hypothetical protein [Williamsia muralis]